MDGCSTQCDQFFTNIWLDKYGVTPHDRNMDPKQTGKSLDPHLQAAYDRVMGLDLSGNMQTNNTGNNQMPSPSNSPTLPQPPMPQPSVNEPPVPQGPVTEPGMPPIQPPLPPQPIIPPAMPSLDQVHSAGEPQAGNLPLPNTTPQEESLHATMNVPSHDTETVQIGLGGSPIAAETKTKGKGISPVILIVGAFVFLVVYVLFWVRFFNLPLPFLGK